MKKTIAVTLVLWIWTCAVTVASAQPALKRLEALIRGEAAEGPGEPAENVGAKATQPGARAPRRGGQEGVGGATPERGYVGIVADDRNERGEGVRILDVLPGGPADKAGLRPQDLITRLGDVRVENMAQMATVLEGVPVGGRLTFEIVRGSKRQAIEVTLGRRGAPKERLAERPEAGAVERVGPVVEPPLRVPRAAPEELPSVPRDVNAQIQMLQQRVKELEQRVARLERMFAVTPPPDRPVSERPATVPVSARVTLNGQPVEGAVVTFSPDKREGHGACGTTDASGKATLTTFEVGDGAVPGAYYVSISKTLAQGTGPDAEKRRLLPPVYESPQTSPLAAEVVEGGVNDFVFDLTD
jgi:hypothetical protein